MYICACGGQSFDVFLLHRSQLCALRLVLSLNLELAILVSLASQVVPESSGLHSLLAEIIGWYHAPLDCPSVWGSEGQTFLLQDRLCCFPSWGSESLPCFPHRELYIGRDVLSWGTCPDMEMSLYSTASTRSFRKPSRRLLLISSTTHL